MSWCSLKTFSVWLAAVACLAAGSIANAGVIQWAKVGDPVTGLGFLYPAI